MFDLALLQAINDWQRGGSTTQKMKRGLALEKEAKRLPPVFRSCQLCCFRQLALEKGALWKLSDTLQLPETISAWTVNLTVAQNFKGGVPPAGMQGVIFVSFPAKSSIIINLDRLYKNREFNEAIALHKTSITGFYDGIGKYSGSQNEVVLKIKKVKIDDLFQLGGFSSNKDELVREIYGNSPTKSDFADFDFCLKITNQKLGACWIGDSSKDRVISKIKAVMPKLRKIKKLQEMPSTI